MKTEFELYNTFQSYSMAIEPVCKAIEKYNNVRPHLSCKMMTPAQRHNQEIIENQKLSNPDVRIYQFDEKAL